MAVVLKAHISAYNLRYLMTFLAYNNNNNFNNHYNTETKRIRRV